MFEVDSCQLALVEKGVLGGHGMTEAGFGSPLMSCNISLYL